MAASFTPEQLAAIHWHFAMRYRATHAIDYRWRRFGLYLVLLVGRDHRAE
ncbi:hypothetical protein [Acidiphilium sp. MT5]